MIWRKSALLGEKTILPATHPRAFSVAMADMHLYWHPEAKLR
jgi:hypothetical protein